MNEKLSTGGRRWPGIALILLALAPVMPAGAASWQMILADAGRRMEIDRASIKPQDDGKIVAWGRIIFDKPVPDGQGGSYSIVEAQNRYDCAARTFMTLRRVYRKDEKTLLREEEGKVAAELPVRSGTLDEKIFRIACRPPGLAGSKQDFEKVVQGANEAAAEMRKANEAKVREAAKQDAARARPEGPPRLSIELQGKPKSPPAIPRRQAVAKPVPAPDVPWDYEGAGGPEHWSRLKAEYALCGSGRRQSPIDLRDTLRVDQPPIDFRYRPSQFRIADTGHAVEVVVGDHAIDFMGKTYRLNRLHFHRPGEHRIDGRGFAMSAHLEHRAADGEVAIVAVNLVPGSEHRLLQTLLNHLPLERHEVVAPPQAVVDLGELLPASRAYFHYLGSLSVPPCSEGVTWLVLRDPVEVSAAQVAIFARLHENNARPLQPANSRRIKESR